MIKNQWYAVLESKEVKKIPVGVTRMGEKIVFWRDSKGSLFCLKDKCVHRGAQLSKGKITKDHLICPFHGFEYNSTGKVTTIPANGRAAVVKERFKVHSYTTKEQNGFIYIFWSNRAPLPDEKPSFFTDIDKTFSYSTVKDPWKVHYSRAIENQLDCVHLPFVHHNTIGRGNKTVINGPLVKWIKNQMFCFFVYNQKDEGQIALKESQMAPIDLENDYHLCFTFPNLWQNYIADKVRVVAAFVPVDDQNTILYLRFYQKFMRVPGLRFLINKLAARFNIFVAHQDRRVVETQQPIQTSLKMGEQLINGDRPIIEYRKKRKELKNQ